MEIKSFNPQFMKIGVLTAALQELTPREVRDPDPDRAIEDWVAFARELGVDNIQLSAALHPSESDVPAEAMLDPVANTLDLREPFNEARARRVLAALSEHKIGLSDLGYFDNMLHEDPAVRRKKHEFMLRVFDAAALLGADAVCGFVGRNQSLEHGSEPAGLRRKLRPAAEGGEGARPDLPRRAVPDAGLDDRATIFTTTSPTRPAPGSRFTASASAEGVGDQFRIHYDPSHAILMGQDTRSIFQYLKDAGYNFLIGGFHVKGQVIDARGVAAWGYGGQTVERGDWIDGKPSRIPRIRRTPG